MSRELTEKKQRNIRGDKAVVKPETIQEPYQDLEPLTRAIRKPFLQRWTAKRL